MPSDSKIVQHVDGVNYEQSAYSKRYCFLYFAEVSSDFSKKQKSAYIGVSGAELLSFVIKQNTTVQNIDIQSDFFEKFKFCVI